MNKSTPIQNLYVVGQPDGEKDGKNAASVRIDPYVLLNAPSSLSINSLIITGVPALPFCEVCSISCNLIIGLTKDFDDNQHSENAPLHTFLLTREQANCDTIQVNLYTGAIQRFTINHTSHILNLMLIPRERKSNARAENLKIHCQVSIYSANR